jgi:hypothetical protein
MNSASSAVVVSITKVLVKVVLKDVFGGRTASPDVCKTEVIAEGQFE